MWESRKPLDEHLAVVQFGRTGRLGRSGREFESLLLDSAEESFREIEKRRGRATALRTCPDVSAGILHVKAAPEGQRTRYS